MRDTTRSARATRPGSSRVVPAAVALLVAPLAGCGGAPTTAEPTPPPPLAISAERAKVDRLLAHSEVQGIVAGRAREFSRRVALMAGDLSDSELERLVPAVQEGFQPSRMREDVAAFLLDEAPPGTIDEVLGWLEHGANARVDSIANAHEPELSLEEFAATLSPEAVDQPRTRLFVDWARAQGAGDFFVLIDQALDEAAYKVWATFREDAPEFTPLYGEPLALQLQTSLGAGVISFMYRFETVPDELLRAATAEYSTPAGQWFVESYSLAVATSIRAAGDRVVAQLNEGSASRLRGAQRYVGAARHPDTASRRLRRHSDGS